MPSRRFITWVVVVMLLFTVLNLPVDGGSLKLDYSWAGYPWVFAFWDGRQIELFDTTNLVANVLLASVAALIVACVCCWSQSKVA